MSARGRDNEEPMAGEELVSLLYGELHRFIPVLAHAKGFRVVRLVHGRGRGVQRATVQRHLDRHALVAEFWDDPDAHLGETVARLAD